MKRVLITGANSYVGTNVEKWLMKEPDKYYVETLDMKDPNWKEFDFSKFDVVFHVAGIAHVSTKKSMKDLYFKINRDLAIETATIAKNSGVKSFIFMSSMIVYSSKNFRITENTKPNPDNFYGRSKLEAEIGIKSLSSNGFNVTILRPPMIYGRDSLGNFPTLVKFNRFFLFVPQINNVKSLLYIDNLCIYIEKIIDHNISGIIYPRNSENISTNLIIKTIRLYYNRKTKESLLLSFILKICLPFSNKMRKLFHSRYYQINEESSLELINFKDSLYKTLGGK